MEQNYILSDGLIIEVKVVNRRERFGYKQLQVIPVSGSGEKWINEASLMKSAKNKIVKIK